MAETESKWWHPLWKFFVHTFVGTLIFILITIPAWALSLYVKFLTDRGLNPTLVGGMQLAEYFLFGVDLLLFGWFVARAAIRAGREL
jgi:cation transporter-like permease